MAKRRKSAKRKTSGKGRKRTSKKRASSKAKYKVGTFRPTTFQKFLMNQPEKAKAFFAKKRKIRTKKGR